MKQPIVWLCLSLLASNVLGSIVAGPYQSVFFWYAYRLDIKVFGPEKIHIASGCIGTGPGRTCYFDEFLKYIQRIGDESLPWTGRTSVGTNLNPGVFDAAHDLATSGTAGTSSRYNNAYEPYKLLPSEYVEGVKSSPPLGDVFKQVVDRIQKCRQQLSDDKFDNDVDEVKRAIVSVLEARKHDRAKIIIEKLNGEIQKHGYTWKVETTTERAPNLSTWEQVDTEATLRAHPEANTALREIITNFVAQFDSSTDNNGRHARAIQAAQAAQDRLIRAGVRDTLFLRLLEENLSRGAKMFKELVQREG